MKRYLLVFLVFYISAQASIEVVKATTNIKYKKQILKSDIYIDSISFTSLPKFCKPVMINDLLKQNYYAKSYIRRGKVICTRDIYQPKKIDKVLFNFGSIEIERNGKIIRETKDYIRLRDENGKVKKIYTNGRVN